MQAISVDVTDTGPKSLTAIEALYFIEQDLLIYIDGTNNPVFAANDAIEIEENDLAHITFDWLTENDWDVDEDALTITAVSYADETLEDLSINAFYEDGYLELITGDAFDFLKEGETITREFELTVSDGRGAEDTSRLTVTITGVNDAPEMIVADHVTLDENTTDVHGPIEASDAEGDAFMFRISGGADRDLFTINSETGEISFKSAPDFETALDEDGDNIYDLTIEVADQFGASTDHQMHITVTDVDETPPAAPRINEIHYENSGDDVGEFIEIRIPQGTDISTISVQLYDGTSGQMYHEFTLTPQMKTLETADFEYYVWQDEAVELQNGIRDGISIADGSQVIEFLSYEGVFSAIDGPAQGLQSEDILVQERGIEAPGLSLQRNEDGTWSWPDIATKGTENGFEHESTLRINEIHYDNAGKDTGEFIEFRALSGDNVENITIEVYNGATGRVIETAKLADFTVTSDGTFDYFVWELPENGLQNGGSTPEAITISQNGTVIEFLSYVGDMIALNGTAQGLQSTDIGVSEDGTTPIGYSLQRMEGDTWADATEATLGLANDIGAITHDYLV